jgi:hypothetical protein
MCAIYKAILHRTTGTRAYKPDAQAKERSPSTGSSPSLARQACMGRTYRPEAQAMGATFDGVSGLCFCDLRLVKHVTKRQA